jgi:serine/threonine-protein kinase
VTVEQSHEEQPPRRPTRWPWLVGLLALVLAVVGGAYLLTREDEDEPAATTSAATTDAATTGQATTAAPEAVTVVNVAGRTVEDAAEVFAADGLLVDLRYVVSSQAAGRVISQAVPPGTELPPGEFVLLNVSAGPSANAWFSVADVAGLQLDEARTTLEQAGFEVLALKPEGEARDADTVDGQTPEAGAGIPRGAVVVLYVSG